jgi:predicted RNA-binding Zn-ribbon protein involved in translation (DUF1610 family)
MAISLQEYRDEHTPHLAGEAKCIACGHEWVSVCPVGVAFFECPKCGVHKGCMKYETVRDDPIWTCSCGNNYFTMTQHGMYCPACGDWQVGF